MAVWRMRQACPEAEIMCQGCQTAGDGDQQEEGTEQRMDVGVGTRFCFHTADTAGRCTPCLVEVSRGLSCVQRFTGLATKVVVGWLAVFMQCRLLLHSIYAAEEAAPWAAGGTANYGSALEG